MPSPKSESVVQAEVLLAVGGMKGVRLWRQHVGRVKDAKTGRWHHFGIPGMADLSGVLSCCGIRLEIECKRPGGKQSDAQRRWQTIMMEHGALYFVTSDPEHAVEQVNAHRRDCGFWKNKGGPGASTETPARSE